MSVRSRLAFLRAACLLALTAVVPSLAGAQGNPNAPTTPTTVNITGGAAGETRRLPAGQAEFGIRVPLRPNAENTLTVVATNDQGQRATQTAKITQITLGEIVRAQVTAQRLTTQEVRALVADGTIDIKDPANFNVSVFIIVLTINGEAARVEVPVVTPKEAPLGFGPPISIGCSGTGQIQTTERAIAIPCGGGGGGGDTPPVQVIPFEIDAPGAPVEARVPGVIIIEGRIKTLKEFFKVNLLLMNVSQIFDLRKITARLEVPEGALAHVAPASGTVALADIGPGGESTGEFIVRGDRIGTHTVTAHFGAELVSPFLPEPVPIAGSASTDLDVKGPPKLGVTVEHPNFVRAGEIYDLTIHIANQDELLDALYTTFELDIGLDAQLVDDLTGEPLDAPAIQELGDILHGQSVTRRFRVLAKKTGPITSCTAAATENIKLSVVFTGQGGGPNCAIGTLPSQMASPDGKPTVTVVPTHNTKGVGVGSALTAIFSAPMIVETITTGYDGASFRVIGPDGAVHPGTLQFGAIFGGTVAAFLPSRPYAVNAEYTILVEPAIFDENGLGLASGITARFTTENPGAPVDTQAPTGTLVVEPPVNPDAIVKGQLVPVVVDSVDNVSVARVDLFLDGALVDTKKPNSPVRFMVDTAALSQGSEHVLLAKLRDEAGNETTLQRSVQIAGDVTPPALALNAPASVARGASLPVLVVAADDGRVDRVRLFVDGAAAPLTTLLVPPYAFTVPTADLAPGAHSLRVEAVDGVGNTSEAAQGFQVSADTVPPAVAFISPTAQAQVRAGTPVSVVTVATDDIGLGALEVFLDAELAPRSTGIAGFTLPTDGLPDGVHTLRAVARDLAGNANATTVEFELITPARDTTPPAAPLAASLSVSLPVNGTVLVTGLPGAVEGQARIEVQNTVSLATLQIQAQVNGGFSGQLDGAGGDMLSLVAVDLTGNRSQPTLLEVPRPASLVSIVVSPAGLLLNKATPSAQLSVTGQYSDGSLRPVPSGEATFTALVPAVAAVSPAGVVAAGTNGAGVIRVAVAGAPAVDVPVTVAMPVITNVTVDPAAVTLNDIGRTERLTVRAVYSDGTITAFPDPVAFSSQAPGVASVDSGGLVTGIAAGATSVTVAPTGFAPVVVPVTVTQKALQSISVSPSTLTFVGAGQSQALTVTGLYTDGSSQVLTGGLTFTSQDPAVASVAGNVVSSGANGTTAITVSTPGIAAVQVPVTVKSLVGLTVSPDAATLIGAGKTQQLSVAGVYSDGTTIASPAGVTYESSDPSVATVSAAGLVASIGLGNATVSARLGALPPAQSQITVIARTATALVVTPASRTFTAAGESVMLQVSAQFNDGTTGPPEVPVTFATRDPLVATVSPAGEVVAVANGATVIDVVSGGVTATVPIVVDIPPVNPPPVIDSLDRPRAGEGDRFAIRGRYFGATPAANLVRIGVAVASVVSARGDELVALVPNGAATGQVTVTVAGQVSNPVDLGIYARRAASTLVTTAVPTGVGPVIVGLPNVVVRSGDKVMLSSAPDMLAPLGFTGALTASVDGGAAIPVNPAGVATDLSGDVGEGMHTVQLRLDGASVGFTRAVYLIVGPAGTGPLVGERSVLSVNHSLQVPVTFTNLLGLDNLPVPDGTVVAVSTLGGCNHRDRGTTCINSAGGAIVNGGPNPGDVRIRNFVVSGGRIDVLYDPVGTEQRVSTEGTAMVSVLPTTVAGTVSGSMALANVPVQLTSLDTVHAPRTQSAVIADGMGKLVGIALQDFRDSAGREVPDVRIAVSTLGGCNHRDRSSSCLNSAGGDITNGDASPEVGDARMKAFTIQNDRVDVQYSPGGVMTPVGTIATALVQVLPARPNGVRISNWTFSDTPVTLSGPGTADVRVTVSPTTVLADNGDNRVTVTISGLVDAAGNPVPDGTKVVVSTLGGCNHRDKDNNCVNSAGGLIKNGSPSPEVGDGRMRVLDVVNGQVTATYTAEGVVLPTPSSATARLSFIPAQPNGTRIGNLAFVVADVGLTSIDSAVTSATPQSVVADNLPKTVVIAVTNIRDTAGNPVPDGAIVVASTLGGCNHRDRDNNCLNSAGGIITNGDASPELGDARMKLFTVSGGQIEVHYDPQGVQLAAGETAVANVILMTANRATRARISNTAFAVVPVALSSAGATVANVAVVPTSVYADGQANRSIVTVTNIVDGQGRPVPDGTKVAVSTLSGCNHRDIANNCIYSVEGSIESGSPSPELGDARLRVHQVTNGTIQVVYNSAPNAFATGQSGVTVVQFLPANPGGIRIGNRAFVTAAISVAGPASADVAGPGSVLAGGQGVYTVSNLRDVAGVPLPDGTKVAVSTLGSCFHRDAAGNCINSSEGSIVGGDWSPELGDARIRVFTVQGGGFTFSFQAPASGTSVLQLLPANGGGVRISNRAFAVKAVSITP